MQNPTEKNGIKRFVLQKRIQQIRNVIQSHLFGFIGKVPFFIALKPAPITVQHDRLRTLGTQQVRNG